MKILFTLLLFTLSFQTFSQQDEANTTARAEFILRFTKTKYITWPRSSRKHFEITILRDSALYEELKKSVPNKTMFGRNIQVLFAQNTSTIKEGSDLIYLHAADGFPMQDLLNRFKGKPVLLVGENYPYHSCMINLVTLNGKTVYEINEDLLNQQGLKPLDPLIDGQARNELEWKKSFDQAQLQLEKEKKQLSQTQKELKQVNQSLQQKEKELIAVDSALQTTTDTLLQTKEDLERKKEIISVQEHMAEMKEAEMEHQKNINRFIGVALILLLALLFLIYRNFRNSKKANEQLKHLNTQLKKHKDDIFLQKQLIEHKNAEISDSILYARRIQDALMPEAAELTKIFPRSFILYQPKDIVSGDFFWFHDLPDALLLAVVDCTGHGVPGAMMSVVGLKLLNEAVNEKKLSHPHELVQYLDQGVYESFKGNSALKMKDGMDLSICRIEKKSNSIEYAGVYNPLYIINANGLRELKPDKKPIGNFQKDFRYNNQKLEVFPGDNIFLFSDGYADQFGGAKGKKFKNARFKELLQSLSKHPVSEQKEKLHTHFEKWKGDLEQIDDVCVVGIQI